MQCFSVVENEHFRRLIIGMQPSATVMNRKSFVNHLDILYREQKASLIATLEKATRVCCTADCWTASNRVFGEATEPEEDVTQNCITEVLDTAPGACTSEIHLPRHQRCAAHTLNLVASADAENACNQLPYGAMAKNVFAKLKCLWRKQAQSVQAAEAIKITLGRQLPVPNATRWNSLYNAVKFLNEVSKGKLDATFERLSLPKLQNEELAFIDEYCKTMYGVAKALDILQGEQYMYMGVLQPTLHSLLRYQGSLSQMQYCTPLSNALEAGVKKRFSEVLEDKDLALAAAVHPKFKLSWIMENERKAATVRLLEEECRALEEHCSEDATGKEDGDEDDFFFHLPQALPSSTEVQQWVSDPATDLTGLSRFPMIKRIFIRLNTGIPSSAPAERLFSKGRDVFAIKRGKLSDDNFEKQLILSYNKYCK
ncbi:zinc finger BED domain-containing protein 4-like [Ixodes scapularis]|uniref:zinc finger BED domain-containing protein 4-like n=2 Tax=Ixodes scapularis TaxID=6945 RepID=UPI001C381AE7|nr:zinc finger BED domain-containing protein 4-like [Ixodes scapularis]